MTKNELKAKYGRIANDKSQLEMFKDDVLDGKVTLPEAPADTSKTYTLTLAHGLVQWVEEGAEPVYPIPEEPEIAPDNPELLLLSSDEDVANNAVIMPNTSVENHSIVL